MKICPVEDELFHADRQTDTTKLIVAFSDFANAPNNSLKHTPNLIRMYSAAYDTFTWAFIGANTVH